MASPDDQVRFRKLSVIVPVYDERNTVVEIVRHGLLAGSAAIAGAVNSVAGGGTLISFPAALAWGLPSTVANATNAVAMAPGSHSTSASR